MIPSVTVPEGSAGDFRIERKYVEPRLQFGARTVPKGEYTFLYRGATLVMSDTPDEKRDHYEAVRKATGRCLVAGLGIGMVLNAILQKPEVEHVTVVEIAQEVIDLVGPFYDGLYPGRVTFVQSSIFDWKPPKGVRWNMAWFDVWDDLCTDNLEQMATLHRRFARRVDWQGSWGKELLQYQKRRERSMGW